jgi:hypothetical protein
MVASKKNRSGSETQFPGKLHDMMKFVEENASESIISWELNGYGIKINNPERLVEILPVFFGQTKYRSFRRQLNMWHFHRILEGANKGVFVHQYFVKHNRNMCSQMSRHLSFKPTPQKEQEYIALASCIEPDPIKEASCALDMKIPTIDFMERSTSLATFLNVSGFRLSELPHVSSDQSMKCIDEATQLVEEDFIESDCHGENAWTASALPSSNPRRQGLHDGDLVLFEGKQFFFVENTAP